jgi:hypothetical protein
MQILPPDSRDITVIQDFLKTVSCASEYTVCQPVGRSRVWLIWLNVPSLYVLVPTDCEGYPDNLNEVKLASSTLGLRAGVIFYGSPTDYRRDEMNYIAHEQNLVVHWTGVTNKIKHASWLKNLGNETDLAKTLFQEANNRGSRTNLLPFRSRRSDNRI